MRLTLRTLLAYLDDTLEPAQTQQIGQKVAESDTAQELIARIRQVTRRRRLTTPPETGPNKIDPNTIAEYLDNTLNADQLADVEQLCLASDVHLAEMATCHQILTLVLGEPALVPPTAKQRMYALVKGREAIASRKPPSAEDGDADEPQAEGKEVDETLRLGLPALSRKGGWRNPLIIIGGAIGLVACLVIAILQLLPSGQRARPEGNGRRPDDEKVAVVRPKDKKDAQDGKGAVATDGKKQGPKTDAGTRDGGVKGADKTGADKGAGTKDKAAQDTGAKDTGAKDTGAKDGLKVQDGGKAKDGGKEGKTPEPPKTAEVSTGPPSDRVVTVGRFRPPAQPATTVLLQYDPGKATWKRLEWQGKDVPVLTARPLVSLPGFTSTIQTDKGVRLLLNGTMPEFFPGHPHLFESRVTLHAHDSLDLDLTLHRGRIFLANTKGRPLRVRARFVNTTDPASHEVWDLTLEEKDAEVMIDCFGFFKAGQPFAADPKDLKREGPITQLGLTVTSGTVHFRTDNFSYSLKAPPGPARMAWNSLAGWRRRDGGEGPIGLEKLEGWARANPENPKELPKGLAEQRLDMQRACNQLSQILAGRVVEVGLIKALAAPEAVERRLAVRCFGALDMVPQLVQALDNKKHIEVRHAAIETLMHWIASGRDHEYRLYSDLKDRYSPVESEKMIWLLHGPMRGDPRDTRVRDTLRQTYGLLVEMLDNPKLALRELAAWQLYAAFPPAFQEIRYDATAPPDARRRVQTQWRAFLTKAFDGTAPGK
jgi:hypothetical protein